tara:strand:+ start:52 stop:447 length:396 start_codon:yes stop_codon:yes gene_type:complete
MDINGFSKKQARARLLSLLLPTTHASHFPPPTPRISHHSRLAYPTAHAPPWLTCGASCSQLKKINRKSRAAARRLSGWEPLPRPEDASSSEGELKADLASVLARAIMQRRQHTEHVDAGDTSPSGSHDSWD